MATLMHSTRKYPGRVGSGGGPPNNKTGTETPSLNSVELLFNRLLSKGIEHVNHGKPMWSLVPLFIFECPPNRWLDLATGIQQSRVTKALFTKGR